MVAGTMLLSLSVVGCVAEPAGDSEEILRAEQEDSIIIMNGVDPLYFWQTSTQQVLQALAQAPLSGALNGLAGQTLLSSTKGKELLAHVVGCALPESESIQSASGTSFGGAVGLAPSWMSQPLSAAVSQRWVTGCLLQSLNGLGAHVSIRLTGQHPAIAADPSEVSYIVPDTTNFGNIFDSSAASAFACLDNSSVDACNLSWSEHTLKRICGASPTCGVTLIGLCAVSCSYDTAGAATCSEPGGGVYPEAVTSTLKQSGALVCSGSSGGSGLL
jgi:hypothetical protein